MNLTPNAIKYTLTRLLTIAFPAVEWHFTRVDKQGAEVELMNRDKLIFNLLNETKTLQLIDGNLTPFYAFSFDRKTQIPFFLLEQTEAFYMKTENSISFTCDLISLPFLLLSNYDHEPIATRDRHDRQTFKNSYNELYNAIDFPLVDHYALLVRKAVLENFPDITILKRESKLIVTHDIDELFRFSSFCKTVKSIMGGDLWRRRSFKFFQQSVQQLRRTMQNPVNDPYITGLQQLIAYVQDLQRDDTEQIVFVKSLKTGEPDATYDIDNPALAQLMDYLTAKGVKIGLHGGYHSCNNPETYRQEQARLAALLQQPVTLGRQHFLRYNRAATLQVWQQNGLTDDYTLGFAEREGFRCGTCHPYPLYDIENDSVSTIIEHPLIAMDGTFFQYRQTAPEEAGSKMRQLCETCRRAEGDFVLLWHNTVVYREFEAWAAEFKELTKY